MNARAPHNEIAAILLSDLDLRRAPVVEAVAELVDVDGSPTGRTVTVRRKIDQRILNVDQDALIEKGNVVLIRPIGDAAAGDVWVAYCRCLYTHPVY